MRCHLARDLRHILLRLVDDDSGQPMLRPADAAEFTRRDPRRERNVKAVLEQLGRVGLVMTRIGPAGSPRYYLPHPSLTVCWPLLACWIDGARRRGELALRRALTTAVAERRTHRWGLWFWGRRLGRARRVLRSRDDWLSREEADFVRASLSLSHGVVAGIITVVLALPTSVQSSTTRLSVEGKAPESIVARTGIKELNWWPWSLLDHRTCDTGFTAADFDSQARPSVETWTLAWRTPDDHLLRSVESWFRPASRVEVHAALADWVGIAHDLRAAWGGDLSDEDGRQVRRKIDDRLIDLPSEAAVPLIDLLRAEEKRKRPSIEVIEKVIEALGQIDESRADVASTLVPYTTQGVSPRVQASAVEALGRTGANRPDVAIPRLVQLAQVGQAPLMGLAVEGLKSIERARPGSIVPALRPLLESSDPDSLHSALITLEAVDIAGLRPLSVRLQQLARDANQPEYVRLAATRLLERPGDEKPRPGADRRPESPVRPARPDLLSMLRSGERDEKRQAVKFLQASPPVRGEAVDALLGIAEDPNEWIQVRRDAIFALGNTEPGQAVSVTGRLSPLLHYADQRYVLYAADSLTRLASAYPESILPLVLPGFLGLLGEQDAQTRRTGAVALAAVAGLRPLDETAVARLNTALTDDDGEVRAGITLAIAEHLVASARRARSGGSATSWLMGELTGDASRLDGRYRRAVGMALATWEHLGRPEDEGHAGDSEAAAERAELLARLRALREPPFSPWLRKAFFDIQVESRTRSIARPPRHRLPAEQAWELFSAAIHQLAGPVE